MTNYRTRVTNVHEVLDKLEIEYHSNGKFARILCPFHDDHDPSGTINVEQQTFKCQACGASASLLGLVATKLNVKEAALRQSLEKFGLLEANSVLPASLIAAWHADLMCDATKLQFLTKKKGLSEEVLKRHNIGFSEDRYTIPVYDANGVIINVRKYSAENKTHKVTNHLKKSGAATRLYPRMHDYPDTVIITEGEFKALLLIELGFFAVTSTGGARDWPKDSNHLFENRHVAIIYDIDKDGRRSAKQLANVLFTLAKSVRVVEIPLDEAEFPTGDITDWVVEKHATADDIKTLINNTEPFRPQTLDASIGIEEDDSSIIDLHLARTSEGKYNGKLIRASVTVSAKDTAPYLVPKRLKVTCTRDSEHCSFCPILRNQEDSPEYDLNLTRATALTMIDVAGDKKPVVLRAALQIPQKCKSHVITELATENIEEVRIIPTLDHDSVEDDQVVRRAYYVGHGIRTNAAYDIVGRVVPEHKTQHATILIKDAKPKADNLEAFELKDPTIIEKFKPEEWTLESLTAKLDSIYEDLERNVTRIYMRRDLHIFIDLIYHSVLYASFQGRVVKAWAEGIICGDTGQGKSETIRWLMKHYGLGVKLDAKGASVAGLLGGVQETSKRWFVTWGSIPLNDRRLIALEELQGMSIEVMKALTETRSSGKVIITKIVTANTQARTRILAVGNPRTTRTISEYNFGAEAVKELAGTGEDLRRFDMGMVVASGEVPNDIVNKERKPPGNIIYDSESCQQLVLFAWSRTSEQIIMEPGTEKEILDAATEMGKKYSSNIPLVEPADQRHKIFRLAIAIAVRSGSIEEDCVVVRKCHVQYVKLFLYRIYDTDAMGYKQYSAAINRTKDLTNPEEVRKVVKSLPHTNDIIAAFLETDKFDIFALQDWFEWDKEPTRTIVSKLMRLGALKRARASYIKTAGFIALLREMAVEDHSKELPDGLKQFATDAEF